MSWFVDASAIVAIVGRENDWQILADRLDEEETRIWSAFSFWESAVALTKRLERPLEETHPIVSAFGAFNRFELVSIGERESELAIDAAARYGKGTKHPARLNMGDCFSYACAKANGARLFYEGDDFAKTDLA